MRTALALLFALGASACASALPVAPINARLTVPQAPGDETIGIDGDAVVLSFSGGGARAAAFSYGVLLGLRDMHAAEGGRLIDRVALVTAVSGGSITAAYFGQHGPDGLDGFRAAALDKDWADRIHTSVFAPANWLRAYKGGVNGPDGLADWLDTEVFNHATMADMPARPRIVINTTELYTGATFAFTPTYFGAICSDMSSVRIADAVGASMSVPIAFKPIVVESFARDCPAPLPAWVETATTDRSATNALRETARAFRLYRDPTRMRFLHLADGGVVDNFGLSSLTTIRLAAQTAYGPFSATDAVRARRVTFLVVNAEQAPTGEWSLSARGPNGADVAGAALNDAINANKRVAYDAFSSLLTKWERDLVAYRCALTQEDAARLGAAPGWKCTDLHVTLDMISFADLSPEQFERLSKAPTSVSLDHDLIDALIAGGREAIETNAAAQALTASPK